jgi:uncharacterized protein
LNFQQRDFIETGDGLIFAVVDAVLEEDRVLCFLRYVRATSESSPVKLSTRSANQFLRDRYPGYLYRSNRLDAHLHAVPRREIREHYCPRTRLADLYQGVSGDPLEARLQRLLAHFAQRGLPMESMGVTGSLLIGAQGPSSDFDLVAYGRAVFGAARQVIAQGLADGTLDELSGPDWIDTYRRRDCALGFEDFVWHERRKANKAVFEGTKFDLSNVNPEPRPSPSVWTKIGGAKLEAIVTDSAAAFDSPAIYLIDHAEVSEIRVHTHTYVGQALAGEMIEAAGQLERDETGRLSLMIGSSREAPGEYLRVVGNEKGRGPARRP